MEIKGFQEDDVLGRGKRERTWEGRDEREDSVFSGL